MNSDRDERSPERDIALDMARRSLWVFPAWVVASGFIWGMGGAFSSALGYVLVIGNLATAATLMAWGARMSPAALMGATLGGFIARLAVLAGIVFAVAQLRFFEPVPIAITIIASHLGLLVWEIRYVSLRLAAPGLDLQRPGKEQK
ncbi:MAG: ATP synthase subunit I [Acidimicrobiales bacterium]|nr:ATP synthase subunit I [Acidimicrobiales bacterium]MYA25779.1 ATP synthase subunit I [Acidimicrobiales bacterium]MYB80831.1 ATP synthase subunit I [Acidimicrobiales bacterium]MYD82755.1 ATP synthase subunit I [Acidimicrobiales bacterium]MYI11075.1 ATP synthase subunit I [Acidimicrobiales bacterium]